MKYFIIIVLILSCIFNAYSQNKKSKAEIVTAEPTDKVEKLNRKIDSLSFNIEEQKNILNQKVNDSSKTIEYLNSLVNSFGQIFTVLGIFIAIIALALPIMTYQFGIKPSQRALKDLESNIDKRLETYLKDSRNKEIDNAIKKIREGNAELKSQAISYLSLTQHEGFSENQMFQFYSILNKNRHEYSVKSQLAFILSTRRNDYAEELFNGDDILNDPVIKQMAYLYFAKTGFKNNHNGIIKILNSSDDQYQEFNNLAFNLMQYSSEAVIELFDDKALIDCLAKETLQKMNKQFSNKLQELNVNQKVFEKSYLFEKIKSAYN